MKKQEIIEKINNKEIKTSKAIWKFLTDNDLEEIEKSFGKTKIEKLYNWIFSIQERKCKYCGSLDQIQFRNFFQGYSVFCSPKCASDWYRDNETIEQKINKSSKISKSLKSKAKEDWKKINQKREQTKLIKYNNRTYNNQEKYKKTMQERYGVETPLQNPQIKKKFKTTIEDKDWSSTIELRKKTLIKTTGFDHQLKNPKIKEKIRETCLKRYGVENPSQHTDIAEKKLKSTFLKKECELPNGEIILVQGYEAFAINYLLKKYSIDDLIFNPKKMPEIWYTENNKKHRYFPDIFIPKENKIIEVKSVRTMKLQLKKNRLKQAKCLELGFNFQFIIFDNKMNLVDEKDFPYLLE